MAIESSFSGLPMRNGANRSKERIIKNTIQQRMDI